MKKLSTLLLSMALLPALLIGCGKTDTSSDAAGVVVPDAAASDSAAAIMAEADESTTVENSVPIPDSVFGSHLLLQDDVAFYVANDIIISLNKTTGDSSVLWKSGDYSMDSQSLVGGEGILLGNYIYFFRRVPNSENEMDYSVSNYLCRIGIDGSDYTEITQFSADNYYTGDMYFKNDILFVDADGKNDCFRIDINGDITETLNRKSIDSYKNIPDGYTPVCFTNNGTRTFFPEVTLSDYNKLILTNPNYEYVIYDVSTGRESALGGFVCAANNSKLLVQEYADQGGLYGTIDIQTGEYTYLANPDESLVIFAMDDKYVYSERTDIDKATVIYSRMDLASGKIEDFYTDKASDSSLDVTPYYCFDSIYDGTCIYTVGSKDYSMYLKVINVSDKKEVLSKEPYYTTRISKIGTLSKHGDKLEADDGTLLISASVTVPHIDTKFAGAEKINAEMDAYASNTMEQISFNANEVTEWYELSLENDEYFAPYDFSTSISDLKYFDGNIVSFILDYYFFTGGAHGVPVKTGFVYDLNTGDRLTLDKLVSVTEDELKQIVTKHFVDMMAKNGTEYYWDNAAETVAEYTSFLSDNFYLTDDGVVFFMAPYDIASYAAGFQEVTISFDELGIEL